MNRRNILLAASVGFAGMAALAGSVAIAQTSNDSKPTAPAQQPPLPPGWTAEDMQAMVSAGTPGKMHEFLAKEAGTWHGKTQSWMPGGGDPMAGECSSTVSVIMDGRYTRNELSGEFPGMGPFTGLGFSGFDNVSGKFVGTWIDNQSTGIMTGTGELSKDSKTMKWTFTYNDPITKKPVVLREIITYTDANSMTMEMFMTDPKSGKEYKCMRIDFTRTPGQSKGEHPTQARPKPDHPKGEHPK